MKPEELRIGNYVWDDYSGTMMVSAIDNSINKDMVYQTVDLQKRIGLPSGRYDIVSIQPIPLTEEWLIKFGFVIDGDWIGFIGKSRIGIRFVIDGAIDGIIDFAKCDLIQDSQRISFSYNHIKHVHQLQNLYFALTGEELKS